ncbi:MAG: hypothetical protein K0S32_1164 [Bacteroidetes bacterium]|jgi:hypothetical protein|nr:hypothetical protein [Bacteroidota bacterium]
MKQILFIILFFVAAITKAQIVAPLTDASARLDFNLPDVERAEGEGDTIVTKSRATVYSFLKASSFNDFSEIQFELGSAKDESQYLRITHAAPFSPSDNIVSFPDIIYYNRTVGEVWLSIRVKYTNSTYSSKSYIKIH